ncbi:MAG: B12-binding domain-containing radical SAM protein [Candidatus Aminicenantes bacterium]|nr:MAG: B12-binding domain-containing radical SAM protein [Candidatus Aminicenantes bacterium]
MKISFNSINLKWDLGTSLSLVVLRSYLLARQKEKNMSVETTFNRFNCEDSPEDILPVLLSRDGDADVYAFSCYLWNMQLTKALTKEIKKKNKDALVVLGGPEVNYNAEKILKENPGFDILVKGEGEEVFCTIIQRLCQGSRDFRDLPGVTYIHENELIDNPVDKFKIEDQNYQLTLEDIRDFPEMYYETARGCPYRCRYCSWQTLGKVRFYSLDKVHRDLEKIFQSGKLKCIKFVDSNFALNSKRALGLFQLLNELNQKRVKKGLPQIAFHFEVRLENLNDDLIAEMAKFPGNYWDEYIMGFGLQTVNEHALKESNRTPNFKKYQENFQKIKDKGIKNINFEIIHGLPADTLAGYKKTMDYLISQLNVDYFLSYHFQVLPNSYFWEHADDYGLVWEDTPPHKLIRSHTFSVDDMKEAEKFVYFFYIFYYGLRRIKKMVDSQFKKNKIKVYEKIIHHLYNKYNGHFAITDDLGGLQNAIKDLLIPEKYNLRQEIIKDARNIIERCAQEQQW